MIWVAFIGSIIILMVLIVLCLVLYKVIDRLESIERAERVLKRYAEEDKKSRRGVDDWTWRLP